MPEDMKTPLEGTQTQVEIMLVIVNIRTLHFFFIQITEIIN